MKHDIIKPSFSRKDERGVFNEILNGEIWKSANFGEMRKGAVLGNHYHTGSRLFFFMISGATRIEITHAKTGEKESVKLRPMQGVYFEPFEHHVIHFTEDGRFLLLKSEPFDPKKPDFNLLK